MTIHFGGDVCADLDASARREWLETNGLGGFASSTISGMNTRRYHGLLVAALRSPAERFVLLSKMEETLVLDGQRFELDTNHYQHVIHPHGFQLQTGFRLDPFPVFTFRAGDVEIEKSLMMRYGENTVVARYRFSNLRGRAATFELRPLVNFRDYHSLRSEDKAAQPASTFEPGLICLSAPDDSCTLFLAHHAAHVEETQNWYKGLEYAEDRARGFDFIEDLFNPCALFFELDGDEPHIDLIASTERHGAGEADALEQLERARRLRVCDSPPGDANAAGDAAEDAEHIRLLLRAADQFLVRRGEHLQSVIAGYHWFTEWGRDTMVALPGLAFATGRFDDARRILLAFSEYLSEGMIPNRFPEHGEPPEYNTADSTLWFVHAAGELLRRTNDDDFVKNELYEKLKEIISWHERGTRFQIRAGEDGLLDAGVEGAAVTWMDVKVGDYVVSQRAGKAVEIQALWYNALRTLEAMARRFDDTRTAAHYRSQAEGARASFHGLFWNESERCLYDCINLDGTVDDSLRPNQIFAVSLPHPLVTGERARGVVDAVRRELLTPYGLRTLSPRNAEYHGRYEGPPYERDNAYHQGTVWAWLIGPFITAYLKTHGRTPDTLATARGWLRSFRAHLSDIGLGQISEIFDGDAPHTPRGCIAQAWSVAEVLRCELEEVKTAGAES